MSSKEDNDEGRKSDGDGNKEGKGRGARVMVGARKRARKRATTWAMPTATRVVVKQRWQQ